MCIRVGLILGLFVVLLTQPLALAFEQPGELEPPLPAPIPLHCDPAETQDENSTFDPPRTNGTYLKNYTLPLIFQCYLSQDLVGHPEADNETLPVPKEEGPVLAYSTANSESDPSGVVVLELPPPSSLFHEIGLEEEADKYQGQVLWHANKIANDLGANDLVSVGGRVPDPDDYIVVIIPDGDQKIESDRKHEEDTPTQTKPPSDGWQELTNPPVAIHARPHQNPHAVNEPVSSRTPHNEDERDSRSPIALSALEVMKPDAIAISSISALIFASAAMAVGAGATKFGFLFRKVWWKILKSIPFIGTGLFSRLKKDKILDLKIRENVFLAIQKNPGTKELDLSRMFNQSRSAIRYHLKVLQDHEKILCIPEGSSIFLYSLKHLPASVTVLKQVPDPIDQRILKILQKNPGLSRQDITQMLDLSYPQVYRRTESLVEKGVIQTQKRKHGKGMLYSAKLAITRDLVHQNSQKPTAEKSP